MEQHKRDKAPHLGRREIDREATPEGGQAGGAQGNTGAQGRTAGLTDGDEAPAAGETFATEDQFSTSGQASRTELARKELHDQT